MDITELDKMFLKLAKEQKWQKCPLCTTFVESTGGCEHITCRLLCYNWSSFVVFYCILRIYIMLCYHPHCFLFRCGCNFCYICGKEWVFGHTC